MTTRSNFERQLERLNEHLTRMGRQVESAIEDLMAAIENRDLSRAEQIIRNDKIVNDMERYIESQCLNLITRQQPVAKDLRLVTAALKVVTDIERVGDHAGDLSELVLRCGDMELEIYSAHILPMFRAAKDMVHDSVEAFIARDKEASKRVISDDDVVDSLFNKVKEDIAGHLRSGEQDVDQCVDVLMMAKYLERIGDHAVNISEWEIFRETGSIANVRLL